MNANLLLWATALGALPRIQHFRALLNGTNTYFERLRFVSEALGPHWVFRLADTVGLEVIKANRPTWYGFYVEDVDGLHCPLDPGAPETEIYLGRTFSDMDMAFYAGMGFEGYCLALRTSRHVNHDTKNIEFDGRYRFVASDELRQRLAQYDKKRFISKADYYADYAKALSALYENIQDSLNDKSNVELLERTVTGCLILMCGGHTGCNKHGSKELEFRAQMESMIIFNHAHNIIAGAVSLEGSLINPAMAAPFS